MAACGLGLLGCGNSQPKAVYDQQSERWVLQTDTETLYGAGTEYIMFVPAAFDNIKLIDRDGEEGYYLATRKGKTYMFGEYGGILCDSIPLVSEPVYRYARGKNGSFSGSLAGLPAMSLPIGLNNGGLPLGMQIIGKAFDEASIFKTASALEIDAKFERIK